MVVAHQCSTTCSDVSLDDGVVDNLKTITPRVALAEDQLLKYNATDGVWRNTSKINCGTF